MKIIILLLLTLNVQASPPPGVVTQALWVITNRGASEVYTGPFRPDLICK